MRRLVLLLFSSVVSDIKLTRSIQIVNPAKLESHDGGHDNYFTMDPSPEFSTKNQNKTWIPRLDIIGPPSHSIGIRLRMFYVICERVKLSEIPASLANDLRGLRYQKSVGTKSLYCVQ